MTKTLIPPFGILLGCLLCFIPSLFAVSATDPDLLVYLRFEETSGVVLSNSSIYSSYFAQIQYPSLVAVGTAGKVGNDLEFTASATNYAGIMGGYTAPINSFTFGAWIKTSLTHEIDPETISGVGGISGQRYVFNPNHGGEGQSVNAGVGLSVGTNGISVYEHAGGYMPAVNVYSANIGTDWNHIMVVVQNQVSYLYLNGVLVHTGSTTARTSLMAPTLLGGTSYGSFGGSIDEAMIWKRALTTTEIHDIYAFGVIPEASTLVTCLLGLGLLFLGKKKRR